MKWEQTLTIAGLNIAMTGILAIVIIRTFNKLGNHIKSIGTRLDGFGTRLDAHATRIDQLYQIIVDLLKEIK